MIWYMAVAQRAGGLVGDTLGHYRVLASLGTGGMGEVYVAEDVRLGRKVALKVLPPEMAALPDRLQRFEREARAVAALSHPNIVTLHSIEEACGLRFLTMELVEGGTLGAAIPQRGLPLERLIPLALSLADALAAAHRQGILHRDLKPENVMLTPDGRLKVLDFGLAKLRADAAEEASDETTRATQSVTQDGRIVGTVAYMSPEQAQGLPVDHRSDIFSLGILLYEMATGERPFRGSTNLSVLSAILKDTPRPVTELRAEVPRALARLIQRALEKRPEDRYQSTDDLRRDLEDLKRDLDSGELLLATTAGRRRAATPGAPDRSWWPFAALALLLVVGAALALGRLRQPAPASGDQRPSLAVFYFDNLSGDPELDWLRTGVTEMLVTDLAQSPGLRVLGSSRLHQLLAEAGHRDEKTTSLEAVETVARKGDVGTALVGSFVRAGPLLRIQARLQDARSGDVIATERVEGDAGAGLFTLVDDLAHRIRERLEPAGANQKMAGLDAVVTRSVEAYKLYSQGLEAHLRLREEDARGAFEKAVAEDPGFAMALGKLAVVSGNLGEPEKARRYAEQALQHPDRLPQAERHYVEGFAASLDSGGTAKAIAAYQAAVDLAPDHMAARNNLAQSLMMVGRAPEAVVHLEELRRRGMSFAGTYMSLAEAYLAIGQPERAEQVLREYVAKRPAEAAGYEHLSWFLLVQGRWDEALRALDTLAGLDPSSEKIAQGRWMVHLARGEWSQAATLARQATQSGTPSARWHAAEAAAITALLRGDLETAQREFDAAMAGPAPSAQLRARARMSWASLESQLGRNEAALAETRRALAEKAPDSGLEALAHARCAVLLTRLGRAQEAEEHAGLARRWIEAQPEAVAGFQREFLEGELAAARGDVAAAQQHLTRAAASYPPGKIGPSAERDEARHGLAEAALARGDKESARQALRPIVEGPLEMVEAPLVWVRSLEMLARLEDEVGRTDQARRLYERYLDCWKNGSIDRPAVERAAKRLAQLGKEKPAA
jgi:tetratricopeptide (TPR) repeat protein